MTPTGLADPPAETLAWVAAHQRRSRETGPGGLADVSQVAPHPARDVVACTLGLRSCADEDVRRQVALVADGAPPRPLLPDAASSSWPVWSPDGTRLCVVAAYGDEPATAVVVDPDAGEVARAAGLDGTVEAARFSPDGASLALVVAQPGAEVSDTWGSGSVGDARTESWQPAVLPFTGGRRQLVVWDVASGATTTLSDLNVWEADWYDDGLVALVTEGAGEGAWYTARLVTVSRDGEVAELHRGPDQLAHPHTSPSGRAWSVLSGFASDRDLLAGELVVGRPGSDGVAVDTLDVHVTDQRWLDEARILFIGHRRLDTVVGTVDVETGAASELWCGRETTGLYQPDLGGLDHEGRPVLALERSDVPPRLVRLGASGPEVLLDTAGPGTAHVVATTGRTTELRWTSRDGLEVEGLVTVPDADGPHPLVLHVHGGPVGAYQDGWIGRDAHTSLLVARGYAVFRPNPRGSAGRGAAYAEAVRHDMGGLDVDDVLTGVERLVADGVADPDRLAITGQSYGGFMAAWVPCLTDVFRASVARSPVTDWRSQHLTSNIAEFDAIFLDGEPFDPDSQYQTRNPLTHHARCRTPTLLTAGARDLATPASQAEQFHHALVEQGVDSALAIYPEEGHGVQALPALADQCARMVAWFDRYLLTP
ncbi:S9 family peptidase [Nocardioides anomalus]|uniref:S9 family peptidase n=1 Tax=Nocardioides anomalus TaxID=2712223 RepID=A0A6G6WE15_9ACTN|nr:prolyl oligopeptidase family serine peptidase [Nocardioides anomalus]QIG43345.1 S9 family peptidase [Nocardioides anomalus]